jgi:hypothetical protein
MHSLLKINRIMLNIAQKQQINDVLRKSVEEISISESQHRTLVQSYGAVGDFLSENEALKPFHPEIHPQGSVRLGTAIKPIAEEDDLDIDLVCEFKNIPRTWTQKDLKEAVGNCLKGSKRYNDMIEKREGGKRCWTLLYREGTESRYHMDILPAVVADDYGELLKAFDYKDYGQLAIHITDKMLWSYAVSTNHDDWPRSNPFGYAKWFESQCWQHIQKAMCESVEAAPKYDASHSILKDAIKILKRHRDLMFDGDDNKPISIIITTLAAQAYQGETNLYDALQGIVSRMPDYITEDRRGGKVIKYVYNPVDGNENFADKWEHEPKKEEMFYRWLRSVREEVVRIGNGDMRGLQVGLEALCGERASKRVFEAVGRETKLIRDSGALKVGATGLLGSVGTKVAAHNFHGK